MAEDGGEAGLEFRVLLEWIGGEGMEDELVGIGRVVGGGRRRSRALERLCLQVDSQGVGRCCHDIEGDGD